MNRSSIPYTNKQPHPDASRPRSDPLVPWTSGIISPALSGADLAAEAEGDRSFHTVITAQGAPTHWQSRVGYYWFLKTKRQCQAAGKCEVRWWGVGGMGGVDVGVGWGVGCGGASEVIVSHIAMVVVPNQSVTC